MSAPEPDPSVSQETTIILFEAALKLPEWMDDKVTDKFPGVGSVASSPMAPPKVDSGVDSRTDASTGERWWISKTVGYDLMSEVSAKGEKME